MPENTEVEEKPTANNASLGSYFDFGRMCWISSTTNLPVRPPEFPAHIWHPKLQPKGGKALPIIDPQSGDEIKLPSTSNDNNDEEPSTENDATQQPPVDESDSPTEGDEGRPKIPPMLVHPPLLFGYPMLPPMPIGYGGRGNNRKAGKGEGRGRGRGEGRGGSNKAANRGKGKNVRKGAKTSFPIEVYAPGKYTASLDGKFWSLSMWPHGTRDENHRCLFGKHKLNVLADGSFPLVLQGGVNEYKICLHYCADDDATGEGDPNGWVIATCGPSLQDLSLTPEAKEAGWTIMDRIRAKPLICPPGVKPPNDEDEEEEGSSKNEENGSE